MTASGLALDHLVMAARSLDEGVAWCEASLGIVPGPGGRHSLMGTHNRLFSMASPVFPRAYLEIIAIDADAPPPAHARWFDLDAPAVRAALVRGPQLIHWVARCDDIAEGCERLRQIGVDRGEVIAAERYTPQGLLRWRISVRADGARLFHGALPTLIEWGAVHPADAMPGSGVVLEGLSVAGLPDAAWSLCGVSGVVCTGGGPPLVAELSTPRGRITLTAPVL